MTKHSRSKAHKNKAQSERHSIIDHLSNPEDAKSAQSHSGDTSKKQHPPTATEFVSAFRVWLIGWWNADREKSKAADWAIAALTVGIAVAAFWSAFIFQGQLEEARKSTRLSVRPWVGLEDTLDAVHNETPLQIDNDGNAKIVYKIVAKNYSNSTPATNVFAFANLVLADDTKRVYEQQGYACGDAVIGKPDIGQVLFPGKVTNFTTWPSFTKISSEHENGQIGIWLAGCIGYRDQFNYLCRTKFMWYFKPDDGRVLVPPVPAQTISGHFVASENGEGVDSCQIAKYNYGEGIYKDKPKNPN